MNVKLREVLLRTSILGGVVNCLLSPTYGMMQEEHRITSLPLMGSKINKRKEKAFREPSREEIELLHRDIHSLTAEGVELWIERAKTGNITSLYHLGWLVAQKAKANPPILEKDKSRALILRKAHAFYWWERAQDQEDSESWVKLGDLYGGGDGVEQNDIEGMKWYKKAAAQNHAEAQYHIGLLYKEGKGVKQDYKKAFKWFQQAAEQGYALAQYHIGVLYKEGKGVNQDYKKAFKWFNMAPSEITDFAFYRCRFTEADVPQVASILSKATHLRRISLAKNNLTSRGVKHILDALEFHPNLEELDLSDNLIDDEGGKEILKFSVRHRSIEISVGENFLMPLGIVEKCIELESILKKKMKALNTEPADIRSHTFSRRRLSDVNAIRIAGLLSKATHLSRIDLSENKFTSQSLSHLLNALQFHPNLVELDLSYNLIDDEGGKEILAFIANTPSRKCIKHFGNPMSNGMKQAIDEAEKSRKRMNILKIDPKNIDNETFVSCDFTDADAIQLAALLSKATRLSRINLSGNKFTSQSLSHLLNALQFHPNLVELSINDNLIDDEGGKELLAFLEKNTSIKKIYYRTNNLSKNIERSIERVNIIRNPEEINGLRNCTIEDVPCILALLSNTTHLNKFDLRYNEFTSQALPHFLNLLKSHPRLDTLNLSHNLIDDEGGKEILAFIANTPSRKCIEHFGNPMSNGMKQAIDEAEKSRKRMNILKIDPEEIEALTFVSSNFTDVETPQIAALLSKATRLSRINLSDNKFTSQALPHFLNLLKSHPRLDTLDLSHNLIDDEGGKEILAFLGTSLKRISVDHNPMSKELEKEIDEKLILNNTINMLRIAPEKIIEDTFSNYSFTDAEVRQIASLLSKATHLSSIDLSHTKLTSQGLAYILNALQFHPNLLELNLNHTLIDDERGKEVLAFFEKNQLIKEISVDANTMNEEIEKTIYLMNILRKPIVHIDSYTFLYCNFTDKHAPQVATVLSRAQHLNKICLSGNKFTSWGLSHILQAFQVHPNLIALDISDNLIDDEGGKVLLTFLETKPFLKKLSIEGNSMSKEMEQSIEKMIEKNSK